MELAQRYEMEGEDENGSGVDRLWIGDGFFDDHHDV